MSKKWYESKTMWANIISVIGVFTAQFAGFEISPEMSVSILSIINVILRIVTKTSVTW